MPPRSDVPLPDQSNAATIRTRFWCSMQGRWFIAPCSHPQCEANGWRGIALDETQRLAGEGIASEPRPGKGSELQAAAPSPAPTPAPAAGEHKEVSLDQETFDRVLAELLDKGTDRRVAEGQARRAAMIAARKKAAEG